MIEIQQQPSLTQFTHSLIGSDFGVRGHLWSQNDVIMSWMRLTATSNCSQHIYFIHIENVWAHWYAVHLHTVADLHSYTHPYLAQILRYVVTCGVKMMSLCHGWGWQPPLTDSYIHIRLRHIQSVGAHWYAFHWYTLAALHSFTHSNRLRFWGFGWLVKSDWCYNETWLRLTATSNCFPHIY